MRSLLVLLLFGALASGCMRTQPSGPIVKPPAPTKAPPIKPQPTDATPSEEPPSCKTCKKADLEMRIDEAHFWHAFSKSDVTTGSDGCLTYSLTCAPNPPDTFVTWLLFNDADDLAETSEWSYDKNINEPVSHDLVCNANGDWEDPANGRLPIIAKCSYFY